LGVLRDRIAALDPAAAEQIGSVEAVAPSTSEIELDLHVEVDLDLDGAIDAVASSETQSGLDFDTGGDDFEIEVEDDVIGGESETDPTVSEEPEQTIEVPSSQIEIDDEEGDISFVLGLDSEDLGDALSEPDDVTASGEKEQGDFEFEVQDLADSPTGSASAAGMTMTGAKVTEELEEAEFYIAQDMFDEAEEVLSRILEVIPNHPSAMLRMGEIAAARGSQVDGPMAEKAPDGVTEVPAESTFDGTANDFDVTARLGEDEDQLDLDSEFEVELDDDYDDDVTDEEEHTLTAAETDASLEPEPEPNVDVEVASADDSSLEDGDTVPAESVAGSEEDANESFDLREALADVLGGDEKLRNDDDTSGVLSTVEDGFGWIFSDFKKGVSETLEEGDFETRYDLGIAYREMGLYEDAIGEFRICLDSPVRRFDSLYLMGICTRELTRFDDSVNHFEQALALPDIPAERLSGVYFDLSFAQEGIGQIERACASVQRVLEIAPDFPGASERLADLEAGETMSTKLGEPGEGFESFDELFGDDDDDKGGDSAMVEAVPAEAFESFGDVIEHAEAVLESEEAPPDSDPEPEPDPNANSQSARKSGRKRISFI
jgi:tetratricopeptide (TPR) repeat protein